MSARLLSPDLARGLTLLGIAGANVATAWAPVTDAPLGGTMGGVVADSGWDKAAIVFGAMFLHVRGLPMFATLLGYGIGMITMSFYRRGVALPAARKALAKRYGYLALFGLVHCIFFFDGDIMLNYGLLGILLGLCIALKDKLLLIIAGVMAGFNLVIFLGLGVLFLVIGSDSMPSAILGDVATAPFPSLQNTYLGQLVSGTLIAVLSPFVLPQLALMIGPLLIVGFVAARRGVLSNVAHYRSTLVSAAGVSLGVMVLMGVPLGLAGIGVLPSKWELGFTMMNQAVGVFAGPGIVAMVALAAEPLQRKVDAGGTLPTPLVAVQALGKRSMSGYVGQSVLFMIFVAPYGLGIGQGRGAADTLAIAMFIWFATLAGAYVLELAGKPGPLEFLHRRLAYGRSGR